MAVLYITEYADAAHAASTEAITAIQEPAAAEQTVVIGAGSLQSAAFQNNTRFVRLNADVACSVTFGTNPTATAAKARLGANADRLVGVPMGAGFKVATITNT